MTTPPEVHAAMVSGLQDVLKGIQTLLALLEQLKKLQEPQPEKPEPKK